MSVSDRALAEQNQKRHKELCRAIAKDLPAFVSVGNSLLELQALGVYKETHKTFEAFVRDEFSLEKRQAYRLMEAASVSKNLCPIGHKIEVPKLESQLREVAKAPVEMQVEVVRKATEKAAEENRKPTAKDFKQVVSELLPATSTTVFGTLWWLRQLRRLSDCFFCLRPTTAKSSRGPAGFAGGERSACLKLFTACLKTTV